MNYESSELKWLFKELLKNGSNFTVITADPQYGDLRRGFTFEATDELYRTRVINWFKQDNQETKQINIVPAKVLIDYLKLAISSACYVEIYEQGKELTYTYGKQEKY